MTHARAIVEVIIYNVCEDKDLPGLNFKDKTKEVINHRGGICGYLSVDNARLIEATPILEEMTGEELL